MGNSVKVNVALSTASFLLGGTLIVMTLVQGGFGLNVGMVLGSGFLVNAAVRLWAANRG